MLSLWYRVFHGFLFAYRQFFVHPPYPITYWTGRTVIVTGGTSGLGLEAACHFVRLGAEQVIIAARHPDRAEQAIDYVSRTVGRRDCVALWPLDLSSYESVMAFARKAQDGVNRIDAVVMSAAMASPTFRMAERDEATITVNVVNTFLLAFLLAPKLKETAERHRTRPHISFVGSEIMFQTSFPEADAPYLLDELNNKNRAQMWTRYHVSKFMVAMVCREVFARHQEHYPLVINYLNPGLCRSNLLRDLPAATKLIQLTLARSGEEGGRLLVHAASAGKSSHGQYLSDAKIEDPPELLLTKRGVAIQRRLWNELSERLESIQPGVMRNL
ncbi:hypothetical protein N7451_012250 [Penicillium sp. IBT 35674x]|nr:hypothetical protein N7451_012250 [Penicillium sp. IBT 35674x]